MPNDKSLTRREQRQAELRQRLADQKAQNKARKQQRADTQAEIKAASGKEAKLLVRAREHFHTDEEVLASLLATYETKRAKTDTVRNGILIATDRRIIFYAKRATGFDLKHFPYKAITSIDTGHRMMGDYMTLIVSGNDIDVKWINGDTAGFVETVQDQMAQQ